MNQNQINKARMYGAVCLVFDNHAGLIQPFPELVSALQRLKDGQSLILEYRLVQEADNSGLTTNRDIVKADFIESILKFSAALRAYATSTKNEDLKAKAHYVSSDLKKSPDPILFDIGTLLYGLANPVKTKLAKYSVGDEEFGVMEKLLAIFKLAYPQQRVATAESKVSTLNIGKVFKSMDNLLKDEIDEMMLPFQFTQTDFYNIYKNARKIVNYSGRGKGKPGKPEDPTEGEK
jgi:hypothetical protein